MLRSARLIAIGNNTLDNHNISFLAAIMIVSTSTRKSSKIGNNSELLKIYRYIFRRPRGPGGGERAVHGEFVLFLFLQAHRETEAHFNATGLPSQRNNLDLFRYRSATFYQGYY